MFKSLFIFGSQSYSCSVCHSAYKFVIQFFFQFANLTVSIFKHHDFSLLVWILVYILSNCWCFSLTDCQSFSLSVCQSISSWSCQLVRLQIFQSIILLVCKIMSSSNYIRTLYIYFSMKFWKSDLTIKKIPIINYLKLIFYIIQSVLRKASGHFLLNNLFLTSYFLLFMIRGVLTFVILDFDL